MYSIGERRVDADMAKDPHVNGAIRHDWQKIKHDYITDPKASLKKIAAKYGVNACTIYKKSKAEGWFAAKKKHCAQIVEKSIAKTAEKQAQMLSEESDYLLMMKEHMGKILKDTAQFNRHLVQVSDGNIMDTEERIFEKADTRSMKDAMQTLRMIEDMTRSIHELQRIETLQKHQIEAERLQLERERFEFEKEKAAFTRPDSSNTIRIDGMEPEWAE